MDDNEINSQNKLCYFGEEFSEQAKNSLRAKVCKDLPVEFEKEGKYYCVLHFPDNHKASLTTCESKDEEIRKYCTCSRDQITFTDAIVQSLTTATLQNVEYRKPLTVWGELWIILEKIFAPLQAALLALAIRRKFMR